MCKRMSMCVYVYLFLYVCMYVSVSTYICLRERGKERTGNERYKKLEREKIKLENKAKVG